MTEPRKTGGRPAGSGRVGTPARTIPGSATRGERVVSEQIAVRLAAGQAANLARLADRIGVAGSAAIIRSAIDHLVAGRIPAPSGWEEIPAELPSSARRTFIPAEGQEKALAELAGRLGDALDPPPRPGRGRQVDPGRQRRDALIRWAVEQHLTREMRAYNLTPTTSED